MHNDTSRRRRAAPNPNLHVLSLRFFFFFLLVSFPLVFSPNWVVLCRLLLLQQQWRTNKLYCERATRDDEDERFGGYGLVVAEKEPTNTCRHTHTHRKYNIQCARKVQWVRAHILFGSCLCVPNELESEKTWSLDERARVRMMRLHVSAGLQCLCGYGALHFI